MLVNNFLELVNNVRPARLGSCSNQRDRAIHRKLPAPGVDALYDPTEVINLLRSPYVRKPLSQLHPDEHDNIVPFEKATSLKASLVTWLQD